MRSEEFMNAEDVARYLHLGKNTVYQLAKSGKIASYRVGRKLKFTIEDVEAYVASTHQAIGIQPKAQAPLSGNEPIEPDDGSQSLVNAASFGVVDGDPLRIAGADQGADIIASAFNVAGAPATRIACGSYTALVNLYAGDADAAVVDLYDQASNSWNIPYIRNLAPGISVVVMHLYGREQGFVVKEGNPLRLTTWGGLLREGVRLSNRTKGSGSRVLLDEKLRALEARSESIEGYASQAYVGATAIRRVSNGLADVAIGTEREARNVPGVQFVPLQREWVDIVVRKSARTRPMIHMLNDVLASQRVKADFATLEPCDASKLGVIVYES